MDFQSIVFEFDLNLFKAIFYSTRRSFRKNEIFRTGYADIDKKMFEADDGSYQIVPIFSPKPSKEYFPIPTFPNGSNWPVISESKVDRFRPLVKKRVEVLIMNAVKVNGIRKALLWIGAKYY